MHRTTSPRPPRRTARHSGRLILALLALAAMTFAGLAAAPATAATAPIHAASGGGTTNPCGSGTWNVAAYPDALPVIRGKLICQGANQLRAFYEPSLATVDPELLKEYAAKGCTWFSGKVNVYQYWVCPDASSPGKWVEVDTTEGLMDLLNGNIYRSFANFTLVKGVKAPTAAAISASQAHLAKVLGPSSQFALAA